MSDLSSPQARKASFWLCLPERSMELQLLGADTVLEFGKAAFVTRITAIRFEGPGWVKA